MQLLCHGIMTLVYPLRSHNLPLISATIISLFLQEEGGPSLPDRLFKIILVGNSSVGKTSLLRRFCDDCFRPGTSATVGMYCIVCNRFL